MPRIFRKDCEQCGTYYEGEGKRFCSQACAKASHLSPQFTARSTEAEWPLPVQPVQIVPPTYTLPEKDPAQPYTSLHYSDTHYPFDDPKALQIVYAITRDLQPDLIVHHGDLLDCYQISRYEKNPHHRVSLQDEIQLAAGHLGTMTALAPNAKRLLLMGNHEDRLRRLIWDLAKDIPSQQLLNIPNVYAQLEWPVLLGLKELGWEWHEKRLTLFGKMILKHGSVVRKWSAFTAKAEWEKYAKSGISGHTHRAGTFHHRDHNGQHAWWELGCLCGLNPDYCEDPDWQQSLVVVSWADDRETFGVERIVINEGQALFRGRLYSA